MREMSESEGSVKKNGSESVDSAYTTPNQVVMNVRLEVIQDEIWSLREEVERLKGKGIVATG